MYNGYPKLNTVITCFKCKQRGQCADGNSLPYLGYIQVDLIIDEGLPQANPQALDSWCCGKRN